LQDNYDSDADPEEVTHRRVLIRYRRDPGWPVPPVPSVFGEFRNWERTHFVTENHTQARSRASDESQSVYNWHRPRRRTSSAAWGKATPHPED